MTPRQALDFRQGVINALGIKRFAPREEGILVTKLAVMRTAAGSGLLGPWRARVGKPSTVPSKQDPA